MELRLQEIIKRRNYDLYSADDLALFVGDETKRVTLIGKVLFSHPDKGQVYLHYHDYGILCSSSSIHGKDFQKGDLYLVLGKYNPSTYILEIEELHSLSPKDFAEIRELTLLKIRIDIVDFKEILKSECDESSFSVKLTNEGKIALHHEDLMYDGMYAIEYIINGYSNKANLPPLKGKAFGELGFDYFLPLRPGKSAIVEFRGLGDCTLHQNNELYKNIFARVFGGGKIGTNTFQIRFGKFYPESRDKFEVLSESNIVKVELF